MSERFRRLVVPAVLLVILWTAVAFLGKTEERPVAFVALYGAAFLVYLVAVLYVFRTPRGPSIGLILLVALVLRLIAIPAAPSDDVHRYLFEAEVVRAGENPYLRAPDDPALAPIRATSEWYPGVNHKDWPAIYPPVTMLWQTAFGWGIGPLKLSFLLAEAGVIGMILLLLGQRGMDPDRVVVYAWNPLTVLSVAHQGHNDSLSIFLLLTAVWLAGRPGRTGWGAVTALTASVFAKFLTAVAAPALVKKVRWRAWPVGIPVALLLCVPFLSAGGEIFGSLTRFGGELAYNGSIHAVFAEIAGPGSRLLSGLVFVGIVAFVQARIGPDPAVRAAWLIAGMLLVLPTVHSWYFTNLLPFLCLTPWLGWIFLSGTCILPHLAHLEIGVTGEWAEWKGLSLLEYAPLFVWLTWVWLRGKAGQRQGTA